MTASIFDIIIQPLSQILFYFVFLSYFLTFLFTLLFVITKRLLFGEISNVFFIISGIMHLILIAFELLPDFQYTFDSFYRVMLFEAFLIVIAYIVIELMYKIKMGGLFIISVVLVMFIYMFIRTPGLFKYPFVYSIYNNLDYLVMVAGYFLFLGSFFSGFSLYMASVLYEHIIEDHLDVYIKASKRMDLIAIGGLIIAVVFRYLIMRSAPGLFFWGLMKAEILSLLILLFLVRGLFLYKNFKKGKGLLVFYKTLSALFWLYLVFFNVKIL